LVEPKRIAKTPRERFMQAAEVELTKFVRKEIAFQQADRNERAMKLCLPSEGRQVAGGGKTDSRAYTALSHALRVLVVRVVVILRRSRRVRAKRRAARNAGEAGGIRRNANVETPAPTMMASAEL
jgi:hypothetical protein